VLTHWLDEAARGATLAVSASVLRHLSSAEADTIGVRRAGPGPGEVAQQLAHRLAQTPAPMLIVGVADLEGFARHFGALLDGGRWPVLIVHRAASGGNGRS